MRVRKLKSRLITSATLGTCLASGMGDFGDFAPCGDNTPAACQTTLATLQPNKQNGTRSQNNQNFKSSVDIDEVNLETRWNRSAMVQLLCLHCFGTPGDVRTSFNRFQMFSHGFWPFSAIFAWFFTVFKVLRSNFNLFQGVLKRFKRVSKCFKYFFQHFGSVPVSFLHGFLAEFHRFYRHVAHPRCLGDVADRKLGSRMDAPNFDFWVALKTHTSCGHLTLITVNGNYR